jgi:superfamily II DNA or RNA helicase
MTSGAPSRENHDLASAPALESLRKLLHGYNLNTQRKGREYYLSGRVVDLRSEASTVSGSVRGSHVYSTSLSWDGQYWDGECSCPVGFDCKHEYALGLAWLDRCLKGGTVSVVPTKPTTKKVTFREKWTPALAEKLGRPLTADEGAMLGRLSSLFEKTRYQMSGVLGYHILNAGFDLPEARLRPDGMFFEGWWKQPPKNPWELWQYLALAFEHAGRPIPEVFAPMTDLAAIRAQVESVLHRRAVDQWLEALEPPRSPFFTASPVASDQNFENDPVHALRVVLGGPKGWVLQLQPAQDKAFKNVSQSWLGVANSQPLARFAHLPAGQFALIALVRESLGRFSYHTLSGHDETLGQILRSPLARQCIVDTAGHPISASDRPLAWRLLPDPAQPDHAQFHLVWPDGAPAENARSIPCGNATLYLIGSTLHPGPQSMPGPSRIPIAVAREPRVARSLLTRGVQFPESLEVRFRKVAMRARVECRLARAERIFSAWDEELQVRLTLHSDDPRCVEKWTNQGWIPDRGQSSPPGQLPDGTVLQFDRTAGQAAAATLTGFGLQCWPNADVWTRAVHRAFAEDFIAWRSRLPPEVEVVVTGDLSGLLGAPVRANLSFEIEEDAVHRDWFDLAVSLRPEQMEFSEEELSLLLKARGKFVRLPRRGWQRLEVNGAGPAGDALERLGLSPEAVLATGTTDRHRMHALQLATEADSLLTAETAARLRAQAAALEADPVPLPAGLTAELRPYQRDGFQFLAFLSRHGFGGVLADDMGLGKTVQALAWLLWLRARDESKKPAASPWQVLIVCPKSVMDNWQRETARFTPSLRATVFGGSKSELPATEIVICNYAQLRLAQQKLNGIDWAAVVLDEGQNIKNPRAQAAHVARGLRTAHRLVLTGTPIENRALDLWSLFAFAQPGWLGTETAFKRSYDEKAGPAGRLRLARRVRHFLLRRTKSQVATDLPERVEEDLSVALEGEQRRLYEAELKRARQLLRGVENEADFRLQRFNILASLLRLRQICCHPVLLDPAYGGLASAKLEALMETLEPLIAEGHKVLVFSQFVQMLEVIAERCVEAGIAHQTLTGRTEDRGSLVDRFQSADGPPVFLLSLRAAGTGLNLTAASYVVLFDPWWNPAVEAQAIDRTHRIGQVSRVVAYRLLAKDTIEEKIRRMQQEKAELARAIVEEDNVTQVMDLASLRRVLGEDSLDV